MTEFLTEICQNFLFSDDFELFATELFNIGTSKKLIFRILSTLFNHLERIIINGRIEEVTYIFYNSIINIECAWLSVQRTEKYTISLGNMVVILRA